jgi:hypothetical protein
MGIGACPLPVGGLGRPLMGAGPSAITYDRVPVGEVEVRRGDHVDATDGAIGRVQGLVIDPSDHHVTHVLLDEGHLWGEKRVAIPISAVTRVGESSGSTSPRTRCGTYHRSTWAEVIDHRE